jgi:RND family efflux transporter MFP subunit
MEVKAIGTVAASQAITIFPQVTGIVATVDFTPGKTVTAGQPIIHLINSDETVALQKAKVTLDSAQAAFDRSQALAKANAATAASLNDAQTTLSTAQIGYQTAQLALDKKTILAPFTGTTGLSDVSIGDLVTATKALTTLDDLSTVEVAFDVPERATGRVAVGQAVTATTEALPGKSFTGMISAVDSRVDPTARTLRVEASLPNEANSLRPGMAVTITMTFPGDMHPVVPSLSVQYDRNGAYVWKVDTAANVVHRVGVDVVNRQSGTVLVVADLKAGDLVGTEGLQRLRENSKVSVQQDTSPDVTNTEPVALATPETVTPPAAVTGAPDAAGQPGAGGNRPAGANNRGAGGAGGAGGGAAGAAGGAGARGQGAGAQGAGQAGNGGAGRPNGNGRPAGAGTAGTPPANAAGTVAAPANPPANAAGPAANQQNG